ncbi:MAG TPA: hypothetical protein DHW15_04685, partial [Bacteroidetes bacterium]|nr:hypothetical protein [Bacteroidota bacterium]
DGLVVQAFDPASLDSTFRPGDDFYRFVNNKWINAHPIPSDRSRFATFDLLNENSLTTLRAVMEQAAATTHKAGSNEQKVGDFWASGMDSVAINEQGLAPLQPYLDKIDAMSSTADLMEMAAWMNTLYAGAPFFTWVGQDDKNSTQQVMNLNQGGLGLPDRDDYFRKDMKSAEIRQAYMQHLKNVWMLMGEEEAGAAAKANAIYAIEVQMANASMDRVMRRDPHATYHKMDIAGLTAIAPSVDWSAFFKQLGAPAFDSLLVGQPDFFRAFNNMLSTVSMDDWKSYMKFHLIRNTSEYLSDDFVAADFDFYQKTLRGVEQLKPRWKRVVETANFSLGEVLGQEYVKTAFSPESKERMVQMVDDLKASMKVRIDELDWMSAETKAKAQEKLASFNVKIGYPDKWRDYSGLDIDRNAYVLNVMRSTEFEYKRTLAKIGQPVDKTEWGMTPQTVNAYYDP